MASLDIRCSNVNINPDLKDIGLVVTLEDYNEEDILSLQLVSDLIEDAKNENLSSLNSDLEDQLEDAEEQIESLTDDVEGLEETIKKLKSTIDELEAMVAVKDELLASLQNGLENAVKPSSEGNI